jgi:hypothetical protein
MKFLIALSIVSILNFAAPVAQAAPHTCAPQTKTFTGSAAKPLTQAMMYAGVMPSGSWFGNNSLKDGPKTLQMDFIECDEVNAFQDGVARFGCLNPLLIDNAQAKIMTDAIAGLGVEGFVLKGKNTIRIDQVTCVISIPNGEPTYQCTLTANFSRDCES